MDDSKKITSLKGKSMSPSPTASPKEAIMKATAASGGFTSGMSGSKNKALKGRSVK